MESKPAILAAAVLFLTGAVARSATVDTELDGVTAEIVELRQAAGLTRLAVRFTNNGTREEDSTRYTADRITLTDEKSKKKYLPLKDANGQFIAGPIGDWIDGGRIRLDVPAKQSTIVWAYFDAIAAGSVMKVELPSVFPFDDVPVTGGTSRVFASAAAKSTPLGAVATIVSAKRSNQIVNVRLKFQSEPGVKTDLGSPYFNFKDVFLFDPVSKRKYPLLKDSEGFYQGQPLTVKTEGGSFVLDWGKTMLVSLSFQAPPDSVARVDLLLPQFMPVEGVALEGLGGAGAGGVAASGQTLGLEGVLKDLNAQVTTKEIRIDFASDVMFDYNKAAIRKEAEPNLQKLATVLKAYPKAAVYIEGYTDSQGADAYNQSLSEQRAASVKQWLVDNRQLATSSIATRGYGEARPVAANTRQDGSDDPAGRAKNRRVQVIVRDDSGLSAAAQPPIPGR